MTDTAYFNQMINTSQNLNLSYGYLWWLNGKSSFMVPTLQNVFPGPLFTDAPADMYAALGKDGQTINVVPSQNLVLIRMGEAPGTSSDVSITYNNNIWKKMNDLACNVSSNDSYIMDKISIYPNPAERELNIDFPNEEDIQIEIYNSIGELLISVENQKNIDISRLTKGLYFIKISQGQKSSLQRFIKI
jgi:hypothetical protein